MSTPDQVSPCELYPPIQPTRKSFPMLGRQRKGEVPAGGLKLASFVRLCRILEGAKCQGCTRPKLSLVVLAHRTAG